MPTAAERTLAIPELIGSILSFINHDSWNQRQHFLAITARINKRWSEECSRLLWARPHLVRSARRTWFPAMEHLLAIPKANRQNIMRKIQSLGIQSSQCRWEKLERLKLPQLRELVLEFDHGDGHIGCLDAPRLSTVELSSHVQLGRPTINHILTGLYTAFPAVNNLVIRSSLYRPGTTWGNEDTQQAIRAFPKLNGLDVGISREDESFTTHAPELLNDLASRKDLTALKIEFIWNGPCPTYAYLRSSRIDLRRKQTQPFSNIQTLALHEMRFQEMEMIRSLPLLKLLCLEIVVCSQDISLNSGASPLFLLGDYPFLRTLHISISPNTDLYPSIPAIVTSESLLMKIAEHYPLLGRLRIKVNFPKRPQPMFYSKLDIRPCPERLSVTKDVLHELFTKLQYLDHVHLDCEVQTRGLTREDIEELAKSEGIEHLSINPSIPLYREIFSLPVGEIRYLTRE